jgi:hypothetical protein
MAREARATDHPEPNWKLPHSGRPEGPQAFREDSSLCPEKSGMPKTMTWKKVMNQRSRQS